WTPGRRPARHRGPPRMSRPSCTARVPWKRRTCSWSGGRTCSPARRGAGWGGSRRHRPRRVGPRLRRRRRAGACRAAGKRAPRPSPDVAPFLQGPGALEAADVQLVWRADLLPGEEEGWLEVVAAAPPRSREALPLPVAAVRAWLCNRQVDVADVEGVVGPQV